MRRGLLRGVVLLGVLFWGQLALAQAYNYLNFRMLNTSSNPFRYYVDSRSAQPAGIQLSLVETAVKNAFQTWDNVSCASTGFSYAGLSGTQIADVRNTYDRFNVAAVWITDKNDPYYQTLGGRPIVAVPLSYGGYLYQCDILINGTGDIKWSVAATTQAGYYDLQTYLLQSAGFCQGLDLIYDSLYDTAVMSNSLPVGGSRRALTQYDINLLCGRYPTSGIVSAPCSATNTCTNGLSCATAANSNGAVDYNFCTKGCTNTTPGECPDPFVCKPSTAVAGFQYACLPAAKDYITKVGNGCNDNTSCGSAYGFCKPPVALPSTGTAWYGGYCSQVCTATGGECPTGSACTTLGSEQQCLKTCTATGDCREGYVCAAQPQGSLCIPKCYSDADCGDTANYACRVCEGVCAARRNPGVSMGDTCNDNAQCGTGQVCLHVNGHPQGFCSQTCAGTTTCSCPDGSSCQPVGPNGSTMCVRSCTAGTCASGLQCAPFSNGATGCLPACRTQADCPAGSTCGANGQCAGSGSYDGGSCPLCPGPGSPDAGTPPTPADGGTGPGNPAGPGCGCQGSAVNAPGFLGVLALFLVATRRRRCQRP